MIKITVFGFYCPDNQLPGDDCRSPVNTRDFMRVVWEMEPSKSRIGRDPDTMGFAKLTDVFIQPVYVQALSDEMASGAGLLKSDGYIAIIDAVKILGPGAIRAALRRLSTLNPAADLIIAAGRQNEPDALSSDEIRDVLGLHPQLLIMPYAPEQPKTVRRIIQRLVRYIDNSKRVPPPIFAGETPVAPPVVAEHNRPSNAEKPLLPQIRGIAHVTLNVHDVARSVAFYHDVLGLRVLGSVDDPTGKNRQITHLDMGRGVLELVETASGAVSGVAKDATGPHVGGPGITLRVVALDMLVESLAASGATVLHAPTMTANGVRRAVLADPDGVHLALIEGELVYTRR